MDSENAEHVNMHATTSYEGRNEVEIFWSEKSKISTRLEKHFQAFCNMMSKRIAQGHTRYGHPTTDKCFFSRLQMEARAYNDNGNFEHLVNIANYALLEAITPENPLFHFDNTKHSVTRGKI